MLRHPKVNRFLSDEHFSVDGTLVEAWASLKSMPKTLASDEGTLGSTACANERKRPLATAAEVSCRR